MKSILLATALLATTATGALAHDDICFGRGFECRDPLHWSERHDPRDARIGVTTSDGKVTLLLTDRVVAMQLSDDTMHRVDRELHRARHERDDDAGVLGDAIKSAVISAVRSLLDHSAECPLRQIQDVRYEDGRLVLVGRDGARLFEHVANDDRDVLASFDPGEARAFVREFHRTAGAGR